MTRQKGHCLAPSKTKTSKASAGARVTLAQVADASGLARTTVSDILNRNAGSRYSEATRQKVAQAVAKLGYAPSRAAQVMARGRSGMIGLMLTRGFANPFWARVAEFVQRKLHESNYRMQLVIVDHYAPDEELALVRQLHSDQVEGLIVGPVYESLDLEIHRNVFRGKLPIVTFGEIFDCEFDCIGLDHPKGIELALDHVISAGHQRIGYLGMPPSRVSPDGVNEDHSIIAAYKAKHVYEPRSFYWQNDTGELVEIADHVARFADDWLSCDPSTRPTAMLCHNDQVATVALSILPTHGIRVPDDLSLVGYDNLPESAYTAPPLTTIDNHVQQQMHQATQQLIKRIDQPDMPRVQRKIPPSLAVRKTTMRLD